MQLRGDPRRSPSIAAFLSFLWPGLGQLYLGRRVAALVFALPIVAIVLYLVVELLSSPTVFIARLFVPSVAVTVLVVAILAAIWRLLSMVDALLPRRGIPVPSRRRLPPVFLVLALVVVATHGTVAYGAWSFYDAGARIFVPPSRPPVGSRPRAKPAGEPRASGVVQPTDQPEATPEPPIDIAKDRINFVLTGLDASKHRGNHHLTDTLMVVSFDPRTNKAAMISFPRDIARFRLSNGDIYRDKINTFYSYVARNEEEYPEGPMAALQRELGHLLGIRIHHYAAINLDGFERMIDLVGGVDVVNDREIDDPEYGFDDGRIGFRLPAGRHHLDGETALAYVRSRKGRGDSDFTRASRQQEVLLALREKLTDPAMLPRLPQVLDAAARTVKTDFPAEQLPAMLQLAQQVSDERTARYVLAPPYSVHPPLEKTGGLWTLELDMKRIRKLSVEVFGEDSRYSRSGAQRP